MNEFYHFPQNLISQQILSFIQQTAQSQNELSNFQSLQFESNTKQFTSITKMQSQHESKIKELQKGIITVFIIPIQISIENKNNYKENPMHSLTVFIKNFIVGLNGQLKLTNHIINNNSHQLIKQFINAIVTTKQKNIKKQIKRHKCLKIVHMQQNQFLSTQFKLFFNEDKEFKNLEDCIVKIGQQLGKIVDIIGKAQSISNNSNFQYQKLKNKLKEIISSQDQQIEKLLKLTSQEFCKFFNNTQILVCKCDMKILSKKFENQEKNKFFSSYDKNFSLQSMTNKKSTNFSIKKLNNQRSLKKMQQKQSTVKIQSSEQKKEEFKKQKNSKQQVKKYQQESLQIRRDKIFSQTRAVYQNKKKDPLKLNLKYDKVFDNSKERDKKKVFTSNQIQ